MEVFVVAVPRRFIRPFLVAIVGTVSLSVTGTGVADALPVAVAPTTVDPACAVRPAAADPAVRALAAERKVSLPEANRRMAAQMSAAEVGRRLRAELPDSFGGIWIAGDGSDAVVTGATTATSTKPITSAAARCGISSVRVVAVRNSAQLLTDAAAWIQQRVPLIGASVGVDYAANTVRFNVSGPLTTQQDSALSKMPARLRSAVTVGRLGAAPRPLACAGEFCSAPLRGGVEIQGPAPSGYVTLCSSAFVVRGISTGNYYLLTAGHCGNDGGAWYTKFPDGSRHLIGALQGRRFDSGGDFALIRVNNPVGWQMPRGWVFLRASATTGRDESYTVQRTADSVQGMRICKSGRSSQTTCGTVTSTNVAVNYGSAVVRGLVQANFCAQGGDSGGAVFAAHSAYGIMSGAAGSCTTFYQPMNTAIAALKVTLVS
jgi:hypothetical protein